MTLYSIDTSAWIAFFRGRPAKIARRVDEVLLSREVRVVADGIVLAELLQGAITVKEKSHIEEMFSDLSVLPLNKKIFELAGNLNNVLRRKGVTIALTDALIATAALKHGATILTLDGHFKHFKGLSVELLKP